MITAVTAYVPIPGHPRSEDTYRELGAKLLQVGIPIMHLESTLSECWMHQYLYRGRNSKLKCTHSVGDNPTKNTVDYHIVQAQKSEWLANAARFNIDAHVLVWIDYGIFSVPGVTAEIIENFMVRAIGERAIAIPGCWDKNYVYDDSQPCWRFCGGVLVMPRQYAIPYDFAMKTEYVRHLRDTNNLSWEVNTMARLERSDSSLPFWHYKADHDASLFTAYRAGDKFSNSVH